MRGQQFFVLVIKTIKKLLWQKLPKELFSMYSVVKIGNAKFGAIF
tara:strand:+ start:236 stop:370 length:135 start_codon:yes stop_codon:yes gene_type:complete